MSNIVGLRGLPIPAPGERNETLISMLRDTLAMAETGQLQSLIGTGFTSEGLRFSFLNDDHPDVYQMLGAINWLGHEYVARTLDKRQS